MSAGQFNIAKTVDYVGVKVTEVNAADGNDYENDENPRRSTSRPRQSKSRPKSSFKK